MDESVMERFWESVPEEGPRSAGQMAVVKPGSRERVEPVENAMLMFSAGRAIRPRASTSISWRIASGPAYLDVAAGPGRSAPEGAEEGLADVCRPGLP